MGPIIVRFRWDWGMLVVAPTSAATRTGKIMTEDSADASRAPVASRLAASQPADSHAAAQPPAPSQVAPQPAPMSVTGVRARKGVGPPLVMVTAYDAPGASIASEAGVDIILVGDTVAMVVLGYDNTLAIGVDEMVHHVAAVARARPRPLVVADLPWMSFHLGRADTVTNAARLIRAGAQAVKLEGGRKRVPMIEALIDAEIPVMGHLGLTPQSVHAFGGFKVQARTDEAVKVLLDDARAVAEAGVFAIVLEGVPAPVAVEVSAAVAVPTIGIGAGPGCDGQVLVYHDVLGLQDELRPKFVRRYASVREVSIDALRHYAADVRSGDFPNLSESYGASKEGRP
jgi:3-methyl-2-oxobutanoate hydroxymethyltransferase